MNKEEILKMAVINAIERLQLPAHGKLEILFQDGKFFDILLTERHRVKQS